MGSIGPKQEKNSNPNTKIINIISINNNVAYCLSLINELLKNQSEVNKVNESDAAPSPQFKNSYEMVDNNGYLELKIKNGSSNNKIIISKDGKITLNVNNQNQNFKKSENNINNQSNIAKYEINKNIQLNFINDKNSHNIERKGPVNDNLENEEKEIYNKPIKGGIDPNVGGIRRIVEKKETTKDFESYKEFNPFFGKEGQKVRPDEEKIIKENTKKVNINNNESVNYRSDEEGEKKSGTFGNPDEEKIKEAKNDFNKQPIEICYQTFDDDDLELSQSVLTTSYSHLNFGDAKNKQIFMEDVLKKINEGYFPLFFEIDNGKKYFYFVKNDSTLKSVLKIYIMQNGITRKGQNYTLYNQGKIVDQDTLIRNLDLKPFAQIKNHP